MQALRDWLHETSSAVGVVPLIHAAFPDWPSLEAQQGFARLLTDRDRQLLPDSQHSFPLPPKYLHSVLQFAQRDIESLEEHPCYDDDFMELVVEGACQGGDPEDTGFALYKCINTPRLIPIEIKRYHNQVGTKVWTAGLFLTELVQQMGIAFQGKSVLELGAGVGITGLVLARGMPSELQPRHVALSDYPPEVMMVLERNANLNQSWDGDDPCRVTAHVVDWSTVTPQGFDDVDLAAMDCILAADCTYSEDLNAHLVNLFEVFFALHASIELSDQVDTFHAAHIAVSKSNDEFLPVILARLGIPFILIACTERNSATFLHFCSQLAGSAVCLGIDVTSRAHEITSKPLYVPAFDRPLVRMFCIFPRPSS